MCTKKDPNAEIYWKSSIRSEEKLFPIILERYIEQSVVLIVKGSSKRPCKAILGIYKGLYSLNSVRIHNLLTEKTSSYHIKDIRGFAPIKPRALQL